MSSLSSTILATTTIRRQARLFIGSKRQPLQRIRGGTVTIRAKVNFAVDEQQRLKKDIADFYDEFSGMWENIWGEHIHHCFYDPDAVVEIADHRSAQIQMIEQALQFAYVSEDLSKKPRSIVDVGCGIGGSSRYLARKYGAECYGITLSPVQAERAQALATAQGLANKVSFQVADAMNQPFPDGKFDLVWSMESGEYMPDKLKIQFE
ncbi:gamma-tocopherol methyltransferase, chloroplastic-like [Bidens hawaiensis]|uniref:gamma-tocopherol methyltransferase, chloroplastic-like n=1 Tax=Bidens hawaiensis TaxID=980011 RepID=UPI004048EE21